jgi:hypothetical protein
MCAKRSSIRNWGPLVFAVLVSYWLGYQSAIFNVEMGQTDHSNPFSAYTKVEK